MLMLKELINKINVYNYVRGFERHQIDAVIQFLEVFGGNDKLLGWLKAFTESQESPSYPRRPKRPVKTAKQIHIDQDEFKTRMMRVIGSCPRCGSNLMGLNLGGCEEEKSKRHYYKECSSCTYYAEIFKRGNKFYEMEGG
jgi:hypothetical protein